MTSMQSLSSRLARSRKRAVFGAIALVVLAACSGGSKSVFAEPRPSETATLPPGCSPVRFVKLLSSGHIPDGSTATYNSVPPTSGEHYGRPTRVGIYDEPLPDEREVHNLEHGHVLIQYHELEEDQISELEQIAKEDPRMVIVAPYMKMDTVVALTAWGVIQTCETWSPGIVDLAKDFIRVNRDHAPESLP